MWPIVEMQGAASRFWEQPMSRRAFLKFLAIFGVVLAAACAPRRARSARQAQISAKAPPAAFLGSANYKFMAEAGKLLMPETAGTAAVPPSVNIAENLDVFLREANTHQRGQILKLITVGRRISFFYGGPQLLLRGRTSGFRSIRLLANALAALCYVAYYGDERLFPWLRVAANTK